MTPRTRELIRATAAAGLLLGLTIGLPVALVVSVGNPLPRALPHWDVLTGALRGDQPVADSVWINCIAALVWLAWARLTAGVLIEVITTLQHHPRSLDVRSASLQRSIGTLVATAAFMFTLHHRPTHTSVALPRLTPAATFVADAAGPPPAATRAAPSPAKTAVTWTVSRHDSLWRVAERTLGDGRRYTEIYDLNRGRTQPDGDTLSDPSIIRQGWILDLPADAELPAPLEEVMVEPGDTLSGIAQRTLGGADRWPEIASDNRGVVQSDGHALENPDLIQPGWELRIPEARSDRSAPTDAPSSVTPPASAPPPASVAAPDSTVPPPTVSSAATTTSHTTDNDHGIAEHNSSDDTVRTIGLIGLSPLTAAAVLFALRRRRRAVLAYRTPSQPIATAALDDQGVERALRAIADEDAADWIDAITRLLSRALREHDPRPAPLLLRTGSRGVEILLDTVCAPNPEWFVSDASGRSWQLRPDLELEEIQAAAAGESPALPALVTIGMTPEGPVLADLENLAALSVEGDPGRVRSFLNAVALELANAPWCDGVSVLLDDTMPPHSGERVRPIAVSAVADAVERAVRATRTALPADTDTLTARTRAEAAELWPPTVVVTATPTPHSRECSKLPSHAGIVAITAGPDPNAPWRLLIDADGRARLHPLDLVVVATGIDDEEVGTTTALLTNATANPADIVPPERAEEARSAAEQSAPSGNGHHPRPADTIERVSAEKPVEVRVLQPAPRVDGWQTDERIRAKSIEMVVYLSLHEQPVRTERLWHDLWATDVAYTTFKTAVTRTRSALGLDRTGARHLREASNDGYRLSDEVGCDWTRFQLLIAAAHAAPDEDATVELLTAGLRLVTGRPFSDCPKGHYEWAELNGILTAIEVAIADAAHELGRLALARHDATLASWAAAQGHLATPEQLSLFETEMLARGIAGDIGGIKRAYTAAQRVVCDLDVLDSVPASTVDAYEQAMHTAHRERAAS